MIFSLKKTMVSIVAVFFICFNMCAMSGLEGELFNALFSEKVITETIPPVPSVPETHIELPTPIYNSTAIPCEGYDINVEKFHDVATGENFVNVSYVAHEGYSLPENLGFNTNDIDPLEGRYNSSDVDTRQDNQTSGFDLRLPDCGDDVSDRLGQSSEQDHFQDHLHDSAVDGRRQESADGQSMQNGNRNSKNTYVAGKRLVRELDLLRGASLSLKDMEHCVLDSDLILKNVNTADRLANVLSSPTIKARFRREQYNIAYRTKDRHGMQSRELRFLEALQLNKVEDLLRTTKHADLAKAEAAFAELTKLWPYERNHSFIIHPLSSNGEHQFIERVGVDIMKIAERDLITRPDYIAAHADEQSLKVIQEYKNNCISLQQKGDKSALYYEGRQLCQEIVAGDKINDRIAITRLAIVENAYLNPVTTVLNLIKNDLSIEGAHKNLLSFERQISKQAQQKNMHQIRDWSVKQYGFDAIEAARRCYISRPDYDHTAQNYVIVSDDLIGMLRIIENKDLHAAHKELVYLKKQIDDAYVSLDLTDAAAQKERLVQSFGIDALVVAHDTYKSRSDYKDLVNNVTPIDVQAATAHILESNDNQLAVAYELSKVSDQVLSNARHCDFVFVAEVESHVNESIDTIRTTDNRQVFIFHVAMVDRVLGDMQAKVDALIEGKPTLLERSPDLFVRAIGKFFERLNPLVQAQELGVLAKDIAHGAWRVAVHTIIHPITTAEIVGTVTQQGIAFLRSTADFVSDITVGRLYLSEVEYQQRIDAFKNGINAIPVDQLKQLTAENWVDLGAHIAADFVFCKGFGSAFIYLKEIDAMSKVQQQAAKVARTFKKAVDTHLADNPLLVTVEGIPIRNFAPKIVECMEIAGQEANSKKIIEFVVKQLPKNQDRLLNVITEFRSIKLQYADAVFLLDKKGLKHILSRHHPKYWDGSLKAGQSFFGKHTKVNDIIDVITKVVEQNRELIITLKDNKQFQITGTVDGIQYVLGTKNGRIGQFYPLLK